MFPIRRVAWRFFASPSATFAVRARTITSLSSSPLRVQRQVLSLQYQRRWASDEAKKDDLPISQLQPTPQEEVENVIQEDNAAQVVDSSVEASSEAISSSAEAASAVTDTADSQELPSNNVQDAVASATAASSATSFAASEASRTRSHASRAAGSGSIAQSGAGEPKSTIYLGNLFFDVTEDDLTKELARFGRVEKIRLIRDARGLSKGFGYATFSNVKDATKAIESLNQQLFEGRRLSVNYATHDSPPVVSRARSEKPQNPPSKTLFIGNMSWDMTDRDLNNLFRGIKNVIDVRVAIDRRTGQPRGFAHADFTDVKSAMEAMQVLTGKESYGRQLRLDYSFGSNAAPRNQAKDRGEL